MRILLIDRPEASVEAFMALLVQAGLHFDSIEHVSTAAEAVTRMAQDTHDVTFVAQSLPDGDGLDIVRRAREGGMGKQIIVLVTRDSLRSFEAAIAAGANDCLAQRNLTPQSLARAMQTARGRAGSLLATDEAEARFVMAQDVANIGTWDWDVRTGRAIWSPRQYALFGIDPSVSVPIGRETWLNAIVPEDRAATVAAMKAALADEKPFEVIFRILRPDPANPDAAPELRWLSGKAQVLRDNAGAAVRMIGVNVDVTAEQTELGDLKISRDLAQEGQWHSDVRLQSYFENSSDCLSYAELTADGRLVYQQMNPAGCGRVGVAPESVPGATPEDIYGPVNGPLVAQAMRQALTDGKQHRQEMMITLPTGTYIFDAIFMPLRNQAGAITGVLVSARDITEQHRLRDLLQQTQRMEVLSEIAGGVAHDFNNLLQAITGALDLVAAQPDLLPAAREQLAIAHNAVRYGGSLTHRLSAFSGQQALDPVNLRPLQAFESVRGLLRHTIGTDIRFEMNASDQLWSFRADATQLDTCLLHLALNARDALQPGGVLRFSAANFDSAAAVAAGLAAGEYVSLVVEDEGCGMAPEVLARAFEPFFSTKLPGKGSGLGLAMVQGFARQSGGDVRLESEPGHGTKVTLWLPRALEPAAGRAPAIHRLGSVLVVDDYPLVRQTVCQILTKAGYKATAMESGEDALAWLQAGGHADLLVTDQTMPGMSGYELIDEVGRFLPDLPTLLMTGYDQVGDLNDTNHRVTVLRKPFERMTFLNRIEELIGALTE
jgi:PAS domain S-box-containing protein